MKRSKMETHIAVLQTLADKGVLIPTHITYETYLNCNCVKECLGLLLDHNLVQEIVTNKRKNYAITDHGLKALHLAHKINDSLQIFNQNNWNQ